MAQASRASRGSCLSFCLASVQPYGKCLLSALLSWYTGRTFDSLATWCSIGETALERRDSCVYYERPFPSRYMQAVHTPGELQVCIHVLIKTDALRRCSHNAKAPIRFSSVGSPRSVWTLEASPRRSPCTGLQPQQSWATQPTVQIISHFS